jgi:hypothetical protein
MLLAFEGLEVDDVFDEIPIVVNEESNGGGEGGYHLLCRPGIGGKRDLGDCSLEHTSETVS